MGVQGSARVTLSSPGVELRLYRPTRYREALALVGLSPDELLSRTAFSHFALGETVEAAVSGGQDSLALVVLAGLAGLEVVAHHVDHGLRSGSDQEASRLEAELAKLEIPLLRHQVKVDQGPNLEERARQARFAVLPEQVSTGHTLDDQAETFLINLMRGSSTAGLAAMEQGRRHPILGIRRFETRIICHALHLSPIEDPSNSDPTILRNRVRGELIPLMSEMSRRDANSILARTARQVRLDRDLLERTTLGVEVNTLNDLRELDPLIMGRILREKVRDASGLALSSAHTQTCVDVVMGSRGGVSLPKGFELTRSKGRLLLLAPDGSTSWQLN